MPSETVERAQRFAWGFGAAGLLIPLFIEAAWWTGLIDLLDEFLPPAVLDWVVVVWPWSRLLVHAEDTGVALGLLVRFLAIALNVILYAAVGALVGVATAPRRRRR
jgi:hypothetical protein